MTKRIVIIAYNGATLMEIVAPADVFHVSTMYSHTKQKKPYEIIIASINGGPITTMSGLTIETTALNAIDSNQIDTIIVPGGGRPTPPSAPSDLVSWLKSHAHGIRRICSVCTGTFLLAAAGLLDGKKVTTHWQAEKTLREQYKNIDVDISSIFIKDGKVWTSAGFSTGTDLALALIEEDEGHDTAVQLAKIMVVYQKRSGNQPQFSTPLAFQEKSDDNFSKLHAWIVENLTADLSVERMAEEANMSARTFARRYKEAIGCTPTKTVEAIKLEYACDKLSTSDEPIKQIARISGFGNQQNMRRAFIRSFNVSPQQYREQHREESA